MITCVAPTLLAIPAVRPISARWGISWCWRVAARVAQMVARPGAKVVVLTVDDGDDFGDGVVSFVKLGLRRPDPPAADAHHSG
jgi:hypothetical protein